ncbi:hypothetical protein [Vibrio neptunius]|uniref:hypothetical protein n=1 Tax=Vibrio neptunius TaxID=170651 RepID=UPI0019D031EB|nr:hypothetical protein [Vibrio neptunius]MBN3575915.1 hypothetical protein [Vibrio neptunius]QXX08837.1 hypothetical protein KW548_17035 [Vibrio neptunius]
MASKIYIQIFLYVTAVWVAFSVDDNVFNGFEFITLVGLVGLLMGFILYKRKNPLHFYHERQDARPFLRRQSPLNYAASGVILVGITALYGVVGEPFEIIGYVEQKRQSRGKGGITYVLDIKHEIYGVIRSRTSEELWLSQRNGSPLLLKIQRNFFGRHVIISAETLDSE